MTKCKKCGGLITATSDTDIGKDDITCGDIPKYCMCNSAKGTEEKPMTKGSEQLFVCPEAKKCGVTRCEHGIEHTILKCKENSNKSLDNWVKFDLCPVCIPVESEKEDKISNILGIIALVVFASSILLIVLGGLLGWLY